MRLGQALAALAAPCALALAACASGAGAPVVVPVASASAPALAPAPAPALAPAPAPALAPAPAAAACNDTCAGRGTPELVAAFMARGGRAKACYDFALGADRRLRGKMRVRVRVMGDGSVCEARVASSDMPADMNACVTRILGASGYPSPVGGCLDVEVPLSFEPQGGVDAGTD